MLATVRVAAVLGVLLSVGCGLSLVGLGSAPAPVDGGGGQIEAGEVVPPIDAETSDDAGVAHNEESSSPIEGGGQQDDAGQSAGVQCSGAATDPCIVVPSGWSLIAFASTRSSSCPPGFGDTPSDVVEAASDGGVACGCGACTVTTPPSCASGSVAVSFDTRGPGPGQCGTPANPSPLKNTPPGACGTDLFTGDYSKDDVQYAAPPPTGGTCTSNGVATFASEDRVCKPTGTVAADCTGNVCKPKIAGPYAACIEAPGNLACPAGALGARHLVAARATCAPCGCSLTGECSGTMTLFTDATCTGGARAIPTGQCVPIVDPVGMGMDMSGVSYKSYEYSGGMPTSVSCQTTDAGTVAGGTLSAPETVCCAQ